MSPRAAQRSVALNDAAKGLAQQMIFWGHDVNHRDGNALVRFGLSKSPSKGLTGTSCYSTPWQGGIVELHGAVASWTAPAGAEGCLFDRDKRRIVRWNGALPPVPGLEFGEGCCSEDRWHPLLPLLEWLVSYEEWVCETLGEAWRARCWKAVKRLPNGKPWLPPRLALEWWKSALSVPNPPRPRSLLESLTP